VRVSRGAGGRLFRGAAGLIVSNRVIGEGRSRAPPSPIRGRFDVQHEWAYVPDLASTLVGGSRDRERLAAFESFGFPGHAVRVRELATPDKPGCSAASS